MVLDLSALDDLDFLKPVKAAGHAERAPLSNFEEDPDNPRFESMPTEFAALVENVRKHGILQPIVVRRLDNGRLRIRFGARRFRAAVQLALADAPYVVTEDARQFDDYAQVAENERRTALQPLELATFIAKKLAKGESKSAVAAKLGIHPSAVTHLQCLTSDPPLFVLELYHSGACRSPQYLYRLTKLWRADPRRVEDACAAASEVGLHLIESLEGTTRPDGTGREAIVRQGASAVASAIPDADLTPLHPAGQAQRGKDSLSASAASKRSATKPKRDREPHLYGCVDGRDIELVLSRLPSCAEKIIVRFVNEIIETEIEVSRITLTRLDPGC